MSIHFEPRVQSMAIPGERTHLPRERGSALLVAIVACFVLTAAVAILMQSLLTTGRSVKLHKTNAESAAAADYGANLAIAHISSWSRNNKGQDWVYGTDGDTLYVSASANQSPDQRRFQGVFQEHEFRVLARSVGLAKQHDTKPENWLWTPETGERVYEIISTARPTNLNTLPAEQRTSSTMQQVVSIVHQDTWNKGKDFGPLFVAKPPDFQPSLEENVLLSGEDHNINKYYVEKFESERIVTPLKLTSATANFMLADGGYWRAGQLTLNYRMNPEGPDANPHRPRTPDFGNNNTDRSMYVANTSKEYDTYLLGGKRDSSQGKTVTVDMDQTISGVQGKINETATGQTSQGGTFNLVLGQFEDLRNLYINMAGVVGSFTDPTNWWQMYVGQYTHSRRGSDYTNSGLQSYPNYGGERVRAQTAHLMKNKDGQVLVRLFKASNGKLYKYPASNTTWTGNYCWADVNITKSNGVRLTKNVTATTTVPGESSNQQAVARTFFWQELVGYQLLRRYENGVSSDPYEPAIVTQSNLPADGGQRIDKRTIYRVDGDGNRFAAGFDEIYQAHKNAGVPGTPTNSQHPLYGEKYSDISPGYLQDRFDTIYVLEKVKKSNGQEVEEIVAKQDMNSFLFEKDFGNDADGNPIVRKALALHIGYEDQRETTADYDYCDMVFTIYIAPAIEQEIIPATMFTLLTDQWWEQNPDNGLTGNPSHPALVTNKDPSTIGLGDSLAANFDLLGYTPKSDPADPDSVSFEEQVYTMRVGENDRISGRYFLRARFDEDGSGGLVFVPTLDENDQPIMSRPYYYTEDDVNNFIIHEWNQGNKDVATEEGRLEAKARFPSLFPPGYTIYETPERWTPSTVAQPVLSNDSSNTSYAVFETMESVRRLVADIIGYDYQAIPVVNTYRYQYDNSTDPVKTSLGYLAGEMIQDQANSELQAVADTGVAHRVLSIDQPDETVTPLREYLHNDPQQAVEMAYLDYYHDDPDTREEVEKIYGIKDKRFSIGFHRSGPDERFAERYSQDHYEVVSLGQLGFNPYMTTTDDRYVAKNTETDPNHTEKPTYSFEFKYGKDSETGESLAPNFVFDRLIDGAGVMIINGNLIVEDVFAYYGLLVVMGDVVIRPTYKPDRYVFGADGNPLDAYGNSLYKSGNNEWVYLWVDPDNSSNTRETNIQLDANGDPMRDADGNWIQVRPIYATGADAYRGRLVTQGNLLVNGRVRTEKVENQFSPGEYITGELHCFASDAANQLSNDLVDIDKNIIEVLSWTASNTASFTEDVDDLWSGEN